MIYADWSFYNDEYLHGDIPTLTESNFPRWVARASEYIDDITRFSTVDILEYSHRVSLLACVLAERFYKHERDKDSTGGLLVHSRTVSVKVGEIESEENFETNIFLLSQRRLRGTGLITGAVG